jgi:hypothetical protein
VSALFRNAKIKVNCVPRSSNGQAKETVSSPEKLPQHAVSIPEELLQQNETPAVDDLYLRLLNEAYIKTRQNYMDIMRQRMVFQLNMDNVASKRELIRDMTKVD